MNFQEYLLSFWFFLISLTKDQTTNIKYFFACDHNQKIEIFRYPLISLVTGMKFQDRFPQILNI